MANYNNTPVLAKIKIGDSYYWVKDADARALLDSVKDDVDGIKADYLKASDKTELKGLISAEESRAKGVEGGLDTRIQNLEARGRFLSSWNVGTGLPADYPSIEKGGEYPYKAGDYYIVGSVPTSGNKYQPDGNKITRDAEGVYSVPKKAETREVGVGDYYIYTSTGWIWISNSQKTINFSQIAGDPNDNIALKGELDNLKAADSSLSTRIGVYETNKEGYDDAVAKKHIHTNKELLDTYTQTEANLADAVSKRHAHVNKTLLDGIVEKNLLTDEQITEIGKVKDKADTSDLARLSTEVLSLEGTVARLSENLGEEVQRAMAAEATLASELGSLAYTVSNLGTSLNAEVQRAMAAEATLSQDIATISYIVRNLGDMATKDLENLQVQSSSIPVQVAAYTSSSFVGMGSIGYSMESISAAGEVLPSGEVSAPTINFLSDPKAVVTNFYTGTSASFTEGEFIPNVPTEIDTSKFDGGTPATWTGATYTAPSFSEGAFTPASVKSKVAFAKSGIVATMGTGTDAECLIFTDAATENAVTDINGGSKAADTWNAGSHSFGTFNGGSAASLGDGFYKPGEAASKEADTFEPNVPGTADIGSILEVVNITADTPIFQGNSSYVSITGSYEKATNVDISGDIYVSIDTTTYVPEFTLPLEEKR